MAKNKFSPGDVAIVARNGAGHNVPLGTEVIISKRDHNYYYVTDSPRAFLPTDLDHAALTIEQLEKQIVSKESEIAKVKVKIDYLKESGAEKFCIKEFKAYQILKMLQNSDMSMLERAKKIAELYI